MITLVNTISNWILATEPHIFVSVVGPITFGTIIVGLLLLVILVGKAE